MSVILANQMNGSNASPVDISSLLKGAKPDERGFLECNDECAIQERSKRLALALQIENPDRESKLSSRPNFSDFLVEFARKDSNFAKSVHDRLVNLVKLAKESKQKFRSHSFDVMNREKRQFVHEYGAHFGLETESFDAEPKRNVVATAWKDRVWMPSQSIIDLII